MRTEIEKVLANCIIFLYVQNVNVFKRDSNHSEEEKGEFSYNVCCRWLLFKEVSLNISWLLIIKNELLCYLTDLGLKFLEKKYFCCEV